jgi:hypothetical protein
MDNRLTPIDWFATRLKHHLEDGFKLTQKDLNIYLEEAKAIGAHEDPIVENVVNKFGHRSRLGIAKYGTTLEENKATLTEWLIHLQEELMDATLYIEKLKSELKQK